MKMRWKWLLLLSLISISLVVAASDEDVKSETENVEVINNDNDNSNNDEDDVNYEENKVDEVVLEDKIEEKQEEKPEDVPIQALNSPVDIAPQDVEEQINEDIVDVEEVKPQKTKGKYMNYDDYGAFNLDLGDQSYDWNSKYIAQPFKLCEERN